MRKVACSIGFLVVALVCGVGGEVRYRIVPIYPPVGIHPWSLAGVDINNHGEIVGDYGYYLDPDDPHSLRSDPFRFSQSERAERLDVPADWLVAAAAGINDTGQMALSASQVQPVHFGAFRYTPGLGYEALGGFGGETEAEAINNAGQVVGFSEGPDGRSYAFRYTDGIGMENLGTNFTLTSRAFAINDQGWVAGYGDGYAFLYRDDLEVVCITPGRAYGINDGGTVVGVSWEAPWDQGFFYKDGKVTLIGLDPLPPYYVPNTVLLDVNKYDVAVGGVFAVGTKDRPFVWSEAEGVMDLNSLIPPTSGWYLVTANAINDYGQITGYGVLTNAPGAATYRLDPIPPKLSIRCSPTNLVVEWHPDWPGVVLESASSLTSPDWRPLETGNTNVVAVSPTDTARFFRLNLDGIRGLCCAPE